MFSERLPWRRWTLQGTVALPALGFNLGSRALALLLALMAIDILTGSLVALYQGHTRLRILWRGLLRKSVSLLVVLTAALLEQSLAASGLPPLHVTPAVILFYAAHEALSILEHAQALGAPIPTPLQRFLQHLRSPPHSDP